MVDRDRERQRCKPGRKVDRERSRDRDEGWGEFRRMLVRLAYTLKWSASRRRLSVGCEPPPKASRDRLLTPRPLPSASSV